MAGGYGSSAKPVSLDPFATITEVGWPGRPDQALITVEFQQTGVGWSTAMVLLTPEPSQGFPQTPPYPAPYTRYVSPRFLPPWSRSDPFLDDPSAYTGFSPAITKADFPDEEQWEETYLWYVGGGSPGPEYYVVNCKKIFEDLDDREDIEIGVRGMHFGPINTTPEQMYPTSIKIDMWRGGRLVGEATGPVGGPHNVSVDNEGGKKIAVYQSPFINGGPWKITIGRNAKKNTRATHGFSGIDTPPPGWIYPY